MADPSTFWPSVERFVGWLHVLLRRLGVRERDVPDVVQRVLLTVHLHWQEYDPARPLQPWLRVFAQRAASDHRKLSEVRHEDVTEDGCVTMSLEDPAPRADVAMEAEERRALLHEALDELDFERRSVLVWVEFEGLPVPEIAAMLDVPVPTVHSRLRLAREDVTRAVRRLVARKGLR